MLGSFLQMIYSPNFVVVKKNLFKWLFPFFFLFFILAYCLNLIVQCNRFLTGALIQPSVLLTNSDDTTAWLFCRTAVFLNYSLWSDNTSLFYQKKDNSFVITCWNLRTVDSAVKLSAAYISRSHISRRLDTQEHIENPAELN